MTKNYRLYIPDKQGRIFGLWQDSRGKLYKDRIKFDYYSDYITADKVGRALLDKGEICFALENIQKNILYIIYKDKKEVLKIKLTEKTLNRKKAFKVARNYCGLYGGATIYKNKGYYIIYSYK